MRGYVFYMSTKNPHKLVFVQKQSIFLSSFIPDSTEHSANLITLQLIVCPYDNKGKVANETNRYKFAKRYLRFHV